MLTINDSLRYGCSIKLASTFTSLVEEAISLGYSCAQTMISSTSFICPKLDEADKYNVYDKDFQLYIHTPYNLNLCKAGAKGLQTYLDECMYLGPCVVHIGQGGTVSDVINSVNTLNLPCWGPIPLLLETSAGQGKQVGSNYDELRQIFEGIDSSRINLCLDTAHWFAAGQCAFDTADSTIACLDELNSIKRIDLIHLNDSKVKFNGCVDRHAPLTKGYIWQNNESSLEALLSYCANNHIDVVTETNDPESDMAIMSKLYTP